MSKNKQTLATEVLEETGVDVAHCYQCGKCSAGCPLACEMDITSSGVMRRLQVEEAVTDEEILRSEAIWLCASCEMCLSRCPMQIDIPNVMDYLRQQSLALHLQNKSADRNIVSFHRSFLDVVKTTGKSYEIGVVADYKLRSGKLFQDMKLVPKMLLHGKLPLIPETVKNRKIIRRIFNKSK